MGERPTQLTSGRDERSPVDMLILWDVQGCLLSEDNRGCYIRKCRQSKPVRVFGPYGIPRPCGLGRLRATPKTPAGTIGVAWKREGGEPICTLALPPGLRDRPTGLSAQHSYHPGLQTFLGVIKAECLGQFARFHVGL